MDAGQPFQLADQGVALLLGDEPGGLDGVHEQLQLGELKVPLPHEPAGGPALLALDIQPELAQGLQVVVNAFALGFDVVFGQLLDELGHGDGVVLVGLAKEDPIEMEQLGLLVGAFCHIVTPFPGTVSSVAEELSYKQDFC